MIILLQLVHDTVDAIALLHKNERITQALILLYSAIDTMSWLDTPNPHTTATAFRQWVDQYLLPNPRLPCTSADLYSARCGLLHTHTAESASTIAGSAREIWYWTGKESLDLLKYQAAGRTDVTFVRFSDLVEAFADAAERFAMALDQHPTRAKAAQDKARRWLAWVPAPPAA